MRQKMTLRYAALIIAGLLGVLSIIPLANALPSSADGSSEGPAAGAVPVVVVPSQEVPSYETRAVYTGTLVAQRRSQLAFERAGKIVELRADEGDAVTHGQVLARLDQRRLLAKQKQVAAELAEATARLAELQAGPRKESIATAAAEVRKLTADRELARLNHNRNRKLVETSAISQEEFDESFYASAAAEARLNAAAKQLEELETGTRIEQVQAQQARVDALGAKLEDVVRELEDSVLTAPYAGTIVMRHVDEGAVVAAGARVLDVIEDSRLEAWIGVPARTASRLRVGENVEATVNGVAYDASVRSVRAELDPATRTRNVVLEFSAEHSTGLVAGQVARIELSETVEQPGFWVPASALTPHRRGLWAVYVADGEGPTRTVSRREVELIHTEGERSFVRGTLQTGEPIIVEGGHKVVQGQRVTVRNES